MKPQQSLIIAGIGSGIILTYVLYLIVTMNTGKQLDTRIKSTQKGGGVPTNKCVPPEPVPVPKCYPAPPKPAPPKPAPKAEAKPEPKPDLCLGGKEPAILGCKPVHFENYAERLTKRLMRCAKKVTKDRGMDKTYYHKLLLEIYKKFVKLNRTLISDTELRRSYKFLRVLKKEIKDYESDMKKYQRGGSVSGSSPKPLSGDIDQVINESESAIYTIYPSLI